ncbi:MAG: glycoside hydrolase family 10 protein, partial [Candidatus Bathyarchaeia archaeon]
GIYVYASSFENPDSIRDAFELFKCFNINMIFFLVKDPWKLSADEGNVYFNSSLRPFRRGWDWDPLRVAVDEARRLGLELHAWFNVFRDPYLAKNQSLAMKYCNGEYDQEWACPANPIVRSNLLKLIEEIVAKYDVDGIHLDYIRYNNSSACYCKYCVEAYTNETGKPPPHSPEDPDWDHWTKWRIKQISSFVNETYNLVKGLKPHVKVSAYVKSRIYDAISGVFQNWTEWVHGGYVDFLVLGAYTKDIEDFKKRVNEVLKVTEWKVPSYIGIGLHEFNETRDPESIIEQVNVTRTLGAEGQVFFRYFKPCEPKYCNLTEVLWEALKSVYQKPSLTPHTLSRNASLIFMEGGKYPLIAPIISTFVYASLSIAFFVSLAIG